MTLANKGRALLATFMVIVFYVVDLAIGVGLIAVDFELFYRPSDLLSLIGLACLFCSFSFLFPLLAPAPIVWLKDLGIRLKQDEHPELFARIAVAAKAAGCEMPEFVILTMAGDMYRGRVCGRWGIGGRDYLLIGLPLLQALTVTQFDALLAHECRLPNRRLWTLALVHQKPMIQVSDVRAVRQPLTWYIRQYQKLLCAAFAPGQQAADRFAAERHGSNVFLAALCQLARLEIIPPQNFGQAIDDAKTLAIPQRLSQLLTSPPVMAWMEQSLHQNLEEFESPSGSFSRRLSYRIADLKPVPAKTHWDTRPATKLMPGLPALEPALLEECKGLGYVAGIGWPEMRGAARTWQRLAWRYAHCLKGVKLSDVFGLSQDYAAFAVKAKKHPGKFLRPWVSRADAQVITTEVLGAALASRLCAIGWYPSSDPIDRTMVLGEREFNPFATIDNLITKKLSQQEWEAQIDDLGLFRSMPLEAIEFSMKPSATETDEFIY